MAANDKMFLNGVSDKLTDINYTKPKINNVGGKSIGILNKKTNKGLFVSTPLMLTWGINEYVDEASGKRTYDMSLQFPNEEYTTPEIKQFLENMISFEKKIKEDAITNSKEWMNKAKMTPDVVDALFTPILKYPKDPQTGDPDTTRSPTLRIKIPYWEGEWKCELYDMDKTQVFPSSSDITPTELMTKGSNTATVIQCGGIWFANGKFGVTWKLLQAVVKPKQSLKGQCFINLSKEEKTKMETSNPDEDDVNDIVAKVVNDTDDEDEPVPEVKSEESPPKVEEEITTPTKDNLAEEVEAPAAPKKKVVRKKKSDE
jgi:hypothetical protein